MAVRGLRQAQLAALAAIGGEPATSVSLSVADHRPPGGWVGAPRLRGVTDLAVRRSDAGVRVDLRTARPTDPGLLISAALRCIVPVARDAGPLVTLSADLAASAAPLVPSLTDVVDATAPSAHLRRTDVLLTPTVDAHRDLPRDRTVVPGVDGWTVDGHWHEVLVDPSVHRPLGRSSLADGAIGSARVTDDRLVIEAPGVRRVVDGALDSADVAALLPVRGLLTPGELPLPWRAQLEAIGILLSDGAPASAFPDLNLEWQSRSVHARRHALRRSSPAAALDAWPSVSIVLVTHREEYIDHAIDQLAHINYPRLQVVVGLHGRPVDAARWQRLADLHPLVLTEIPADLPFGSAMQWASDRADGQLITKVDDDDFYSSEHVWDLVLARMTSGAELVGKALDWIHLEQDDVTVFRPVYPAESYATFVAGGTLLIAKADLNAVGGWRPVPKSVDRALIDAVKRTGGLVYRTHGLGYVYVRHGGAHTATVRDEHFLARTEQQWTGLLRHEALGTHPHG